MADNTRPLGVWWWYLRESWCFLDAWHRFTYCCCTSFRGGLFGGSRFGSRSASRRASASAPQEYLSSSKSRTRIKEHTDC